MKQKTPNHHKWADLSLWQKYKASLAPVQIASPKMGGWKETLLLLDVIQSLKYVWNCFFPY